MSRNLPSVFDFQYVLAPRGSFANACDKVIDRILSPQIHATLDKVFRLGAAFGLFIPPACVCAHAELRS